MCSSFYHTQAQLVDVRHTCRIDGTMWCFPSLPSLPSLPTRILVKRCSPQQLDTVGCPLWGRRAVFPVGLCRSLGRILANSFSVPHGPVLSPCKMCLEAMCSGCSICRPALMSDGFFVGFFSFSGGGEIAPQPPLLTLTKTSSRVGRFHLSLTTSHL